MDEANLHGFFGVRARTTIVCQLAADLRLGCIRQIHSIRPIRLLAIAFVSAFRPLMRGAFAFANCSKLLGGVRWSEEGKYVSRSRIISAIR
jgi:hypothetical protein